MISTTGAAKCPERTQSPRIPREKGELPGFDHDATLSEVAARVGHIPRAVELNAAWGQYEIALLPSAFSPYLAFIAICHLQRIFISPLAVPMGSVGECLQHFFRAKFHRQIRPSSLRWQLAIGDLPEDGLRHPLHDVAQPHAASDWPAYVDVAPWKQPQRAEQQLRIFSIP
jgi:hypothetical protein